MNVKQIKGTNIVDVFIGEGWEGWSRYRRVIHKVTQRAIYIHVKGERLNMFQLKELYTKVK